MIYKSLTQSILIRFRLVLCLAALLTAYAPCAVSSDAVSTLEFEDLIELKGMGFSDEAILQELGEASRPFVLSPEDIEQLRQVGFTDSFIEQLANQQDRKRLDNDLVGAMLEQEMATIDILREISQSEAAFDASPKALLEFNKRYHAPNSLIRVLRGQPLNLDEIRTFATDKVPADEQLLLIDILGFAPAPLDTPQMLKLLQAGVPGEVVRHLRDSVSVPGEASNMPRAGYYPHPLGLFSLHYPSNWNLIKEPDGDVVMYILTPDQGVTNSDNLERGMQIMIMPVDPESVVADMTSAQALDQIIPMLFQQEPGLQADGPIREATLGELPAAALGLSGNLSGKTGSFKGELTMGFRNGLMALVVSVAPEPEAAYLAKTYKNVMKNSTFLPERREQRLQTPMATQEAVAAHRASVVSIMSYRDGQPLATGSGFITRDDGYVLTNHHVIWDDEKGQPATGFTVEWDAEFSREKTEAQLVGYRFTSTYQADLVAGMSSGIDIALLKLSGDRTFTSIPLVSAAEVQLADPVLTLGFPARNMIQTLSTVVTSGIVTRFNKDFTGKLESIFIDAPIAHGSSGGPTLNLMYNRVFGLNTFGSFGIKGVENLWNYFGVIPIDYAFAEFPIATRISTQRDQILEVAELYDLALHSWASGGVNGPSSIARRALEAAPGSADTNYLVGLLQAQQAETREGLDAGLANLEKALDIDEKHQPSLMLLAQIYLQLGNFDRALAFADRAVSIYPADSDVYESRALILLANEFFDRALSDLDRAKQLNQDMVASPYIRAGEIYYAMRRYQEGLREFERAVQIHPTNLLARLGLAHFHTLTGQPVAALLEYNKINMDTPGRPVVLALIGRTYMSISRPDRALDSFRAAIERAQKLNQQPAAELFSGAAEAALTKKVDNPAMAVNFYLGLLANYWGEDSAYNVHIGIAGILDNVPEYRAIARGHLAWALALRANDEDAMTLLRQLDDARLSFDAIKDMLNKMGYPPMLAALIVRETPLDFVVEPSQESMNELQKVIPGQVALAIFQSQEKHQKQQQPGINQGLNTGVAETDAVALQGTWSATLQDETGNYVGEFHLKLDRTGRYRFDLWQGNERSSEQGTYQIFRHMLRFRSDSGEASEYRFELRGNQLSLAEGTDDKIILTRSP